MQDKETKSLDKFFLTLLTKDQNFSNMVVMMEDITFEKVDSTTSAPQFTIRATFRIQLTPECLAADYFSINARLKSLINDFWRNNGLEGRYGDLYFYPIRIYVGDGTDTISSNFYYVSPKIRTFIQTWIKENFDDGSVTDITKYGVQTLTFKYDVEDPNTIDFEMNPGRISVYVNVKVTEVLLDNDDISHELDNELITQIYWTIFYEEYFEDAEMWLAGAVYDKLNDDLMLESDNDDEERYVHLYITINDILGKKKFKDTEIFFTPQEVLKNIVSEISS